MSDRPDGADGRSGGSADDGNGRDERPPDGGSDVGATWAERLLMAISVVFTVALFAFVIWQGATTPAAGEPTAQVAGTETLPSGDVRVAVAFGNPQDVGLIRATVEVDCDTPPPELEFTNVPAEDRRTGQVICPPGTENPTATVSTWVEA